MVNKKLCKVVSKFLGLGLLLVSATSIAQVLYKADGKNVELKDLTPTQQQQYYEYQFENYEKSRMLVDQALFDQHVAVEAKKSKKTPEAVSAALLKTPEVTDKEAKAWFEKNRTKIPPQYTLEQVKGELKKFIETEKRELKKSDILKKLKSEQKFEILVAKPVAPEVKINVDDYFFQGSKSAKVTLVEFADYQCPHCKATAPEIKKIADKYKDKLRVVYIDFAFNQSGISKVVAQGAYCVGQKDKDKYWDYNRIAFEKQPNLDKETPLVIAKELKLNADEIKACLDTKAAVDYVNHGKAEGEKVGVNGTPAIFLNGKRYLGSHQFDDLKKAIDELL